MPSPIDSPGSWCWRDRTLATGNTALACDTPFAENCPVTRPPSRPSAPSTPGAVTLGISRVRSASGSQTQVPARSSAVASTSWVSLYGRYYTSDTGPQVRNGHETFPCPRSDCLAGPKIQEVSGLPSGTSAPNTVITEHAVRRLGLRAITSGWLIQTPHPLTAAQISSARRTAAAAGMSVETRSSVPTSAEITNWATAFGIALALAILAMAVGLIRSETASDLRTLTATGAGSMTRRNLTAVTAGALALLGALLGTAAGYVAAIAWFRGSALNGGVGALANAPVGDLLFIVAGMPLIAVAVGWLLAGREPPAIAHQPIE